MIDRWTVLTLLGVGGFLFWGAGHYTVFDDEAFSCQRYVMPVGEMVSALWHGVEPDPPLYYVLENGWVRVFGVGPLGLRSLSILFFLAGLVFVRLAGQAWFDQTTGLVAMLLSALHPAHLFFGFAARWYSLMFLMVAVLLWLTARLSTGGRPERGLTIGWGLAAAAACYTNYFGPVVVGLAWFVGVLHCGGKPGGVRRWIWAGLISLVVYAVWLAPLWWQVTGFPKIGASWTSYAATAARTTLALMTGNLASVGAWWVLAPMGVFGIGLIVLLVQQWRAVWPIAVVTLGCFAAGVATRTMIDKYIMTFSGVACVLVAALLVRALRTANGDWRTAKGQQSTARLRSGRIVPRVTVACLVLGFAGCCVNMVTQRHWSSLRWLDPFEEVTAELYLAEQNPEDRHRFRAPVVISHPSARYYSARWRAGATSTVLRDAGGVRPTMRTARTRASEWRKAFDHQETIDGDPTQDAVLTPNAVLSWLEDERPPPVLTTLQTTGFVSLPDWEALQAVLDRDYVLTNERRYLEDPDAVWKDRLDPDVKHPRWRIVVRRWKLRE